MAQSEMQGRPRPLSPHLQVYRWQITSVLSILHRMTGGALGGGAVWFTVWLYAAAESGPALEYMRWFNSSPIGIFLLLGFTFSLYYHLCNGIRHLVWDTGRGYNLATVTWSGWLVVIASLALSVLSIFAGLLSSRTL